MSFNKFMNNKNVKYIHNIILFTMKKNKAMKFVGN